MNWLRETLSAASGRLSSKRVCGVLGFLISGAVLIYCTTNNQQAPEMINMFMFSCMGLLGVDSVTSIWKNKQSFNKYDNEREN